MWELHVRRNGRWQVLSVGLHVWAVALRYAKGECEPVKLLNWNTDEVRYYSKGVVIPA